MSFFRLCGVAVAVVSPLARWLVAVAYVHWELAVQSDPMVI